MKVEVKARGRVGGREREKLKEKEGKKAERGGGGKLLADCLITHCHIF